MPEGPETRRMVDSIGRVLIRKKIESVQFYHDNLQNLSLDDFSQVLNIHSRGKAVVCQLDNGQSIITHNQLYGKWTVNLRKTMPKTGRALRIQMNTKTYSVRLWSATDITLYETKDENLHPYIKNLGPDVLMKTTTKELILNRLIHRRFRNRMLAGLLLNQGFIAGLGNYLRSEILFFSNTMYYNKPRELVDYQLELLADSIKRISLRAYYQKGNTIDKEYLLSEYGNQTNFHRLRHMVFNRVGQPCIICGGLIKRDRVGKRRIDFCMNCQEPIDLKSV